MKKAEPTRPLEDLYLDLESPYALSGNLQELTKVARDTLGISPTQTQTYLQGEPTFTLHRPRQVRFPRSKTVVPPQVDYTWQADLVEMQDPKLIAQNKRTRYLLTVIDVLSKYAWVIALKSKKGKATADAFRYLLENSGGRKPVNLQTDQGKEFYNQHMKRLLDEYQIHHYSTRGEPKAAVVERFNRTLKQLMYKYMTARNTPKYLEVLPLLVDKYNTRIHSRTQMAPADVTDHHASAVWKRLYKPTAALAPYQFRPGILCAPLNRSKVKRVPLPRVIGGIGRKTCTW